MIPPRILLAGLVCLCPFSLAQQLKSDPHKTLIIISTSDIHGNLDNFPRLATLVKQYRAKYPHVLLVDSGDYFMGNPYVDEWDKRGEPLTILMNKLGYDLATIGNHDLDYGQEALRDHIKGMPNTRFVVTNVNPSPTLQNCFSPYASIPLKGTPISVGFIGRTFKPRTSGGWEASHGNCRMKTTTRASWTGSACTIIPSTSSSATWVMSTT